MVYVISLYQYELQFILTVYLLLIFAFNIKQKYIKDYESVGSRVTTPEGNIPARV